MAQTIDNINTKASRATIWAFGTSRSLLIAGFAKLAKEDAVEPLRTLVHDDDVRNEV